MLFDEPIPVEPDDPNFTFHSNRYLRELYDAAQNIRFTQRAGTPLHGDKAGNLDAVWVVFTSNAVANTQDTVAHTLGRVPKWIFVMVPDKAASLYDGTTAHDATNLYLKTSVATVAWRLIVG